MHRSQYSVACPIRLLRPGKKEWSKENNKSKPVVGLRTCILIWYYPLHTHRHPDRTAKGFSTLENVCFRDSISLTLPRPCTSACTLIADQLTPSYDKKPPTHNQNNPVITDSRIHRPTQLSYLIASGNTPGEPVFSKTDQPGVSHGCVRAMWDVILLALP